MKTKWEYTSVSFVADDSVLNKYGEKGWEAYGVMKQGDCITVFMKRKKVK